MNRAYSILSVKAVDDDERVIRGTATSPNPDRVGDIVDPLGVKFTNPMPLLHQHDSGRPVGTVKFDRPTKDGIQFEASLPRIDEPGPLKDRVDTAWGEVKAGLVRAVSIGFRTLSDGYEVMKDGGIRYLQTEVMELSLVTIPANADAKISLIKSIDAPLLAATGKQPSDADRPATPGATGSQSPISPSKGARIMSKTFAEQITAFEATRQAKSARMSELMNKAADEGSTLDTSQTEEYDGLVDEVKSIDAHLVRLSDLEKANRAAAQPVEGVRGTETGSQVRSGVRVEVKGTNLPKGTAFTRYAIALARSKGNLMQAAEIAKGWHDSTPEVETVLKAAVSAGSTTDAEWAKPLVEYNQMASEFIELLRPATILGRIPGLRRVPFNISMPKQTGGSSVGWVGEGRAKPVSELQLGTETLRWAKAAGIVVLTDELVRFSNPSAESVVRNDLIASMAQFLDEQLLNPAVAAVADVSPASITNGVTPIDATGTDADAARADLIAAQSAVVSATKGIGGAVWLMSELRAMRMASIRNALGQREFPDLSAAGGTLEGLPVITSESVPTNEAGPGTPAAYPAGDLIVLVRAPEVYLADDGQVMLDASREASVQMNTAPDSPTTASTVMVSLWQQNMVGLRAERWINWKRRRDGAVQYIRGAAYGTV